MGVNIDKVLITRQEIEDMVTRLGAEITNDNKGRKVLLVCVLKGAFIFLADLVRHIDLPLEVDFMSVSSYGNNTDTSGVVRILRDLDTDITGKHVIIVEDIIDSGLTLRHLKELLSTRNPASISICTAFDKPDRRKAEVKVDYRGMIIPDEFVVGYGLDFAGDYRHLPDVCILSDDGGDKE
ncbi:MAG: hypoxanthine phosphoribosyltransferase [Eubacteriales bacterium]|nr:hypoxanthine phosphoribosyltransferase [Eubacteriales bacterium]MDD4326869.1 hypoxanthine phosphoribosyltransferase [Eubacteriales bacterium]MDD4716597.1 hypoxanthine phosphoribosyltransferase [Eubacteriales bacterium]NCU26545.1 hypoxanthine phosphoribosyltransferase [Candidatus Nomurabacteria bacterium]